MDRIDYGLASIRFNEDPLEHFNRDVFLPVIFHAPNFLERLKSECPDAAIQALEITSFDRRL